MMYSSSYQPSLSRASSANANGQSASYSASSPPQSPGGHLYRSATSPTSPSSSAGVVPNSLLPGRQRGFSMGAHAANLFFLYPTGQVTSSPQASVFPLSESAPQLPPPVPEREYVPDSTERSATSPPAVPPKPLLSPTQPVSPQHAATAPSFRTHYSPGPSSSTPTSPPLNTESDDRELEMALALSAAQAEQEQQRARAEEEEELARVLRESAEQPGGLGTEEDEELARALRESALAEEAGYFHSSSPGAGPSGAGTSVGTTATPSPALPSVGEPSDCFSAPSTSAVTLEEQGAQSSQSATSPGTPKLSQMDQDEALARLLAAEEEEMSKRNGPAEEEMSDLPSYSPSPIPPTPGSLSGGSISPGAMLTDRPALTDRAVSMYDAPSSVSVATQNSDVSDRRPIQHSMSYGPSSTRSNSLSSQHNSVDSSHLTVPSRRPSNATTASLPGLGPRPVSSMSGSGKADSEADARSEHSSPGIVSANQFVEPAMLYGISIGFNPPTISTELNIMQGQVPNIISLPYGKCPPLHLQAPSWRQLLKLLARLSGTRIEPTLEAMAEIKTAIHLRTIIQFVRVHHQSSDWRTILWFTLDHPAPSNMLGAFKYSNGDVNVLPYTYTLSSMPALLRDGADTPMSKYYVIPSTSTTPYPTLPITFPNLAMYLQSALEESRRLAHDSSSGIRRLAKLLETCYPNEDDYGGLEGDPDRNSKSVSGLFKRVIGRGNKGPRGPRGGNEDTYELVTPFVADEMEWG